MSFLPDLLLYTFCFRAPCFNIRVHCSKKNTTTSVSKNGSMCQWTYKSGRNDSLKLLIWNARNLRPAPPPFLLECSVYFMFTYVSDSPILSLFIISKKIKDTMLRSLSPSANGNLRCKAKSPMGGAESAPTPPVTLELSHITPPTPEEIVQVPSSSHFSFCSEKYFLKSTKMAPLKWQTDVKDSQQVWHLAINMRDNAEQCNLKAFSQFLQGGVIGLRVM